MTSTVWATLSLFRDSSGQNHSDIVACRMVNSHVEPGVVRVRRGLRRRAVAALGELLSFLVDNGSGLPAAVKGARVWCGGANR